jgi:hypothetical protein
MDTSVGPAGGEIGEAIARDALRARLLEQLARRVTHGRSLQQTLLDRIAAELRRRRTAAAAEAARRELETAQRELEAARARRALAKAQEPEVQIAEPARTPPKPPRHRKRPRRSSGSPDATIADAEAGAVPTNAAAELTRLGWQQVAWLLVPVLGLAGALVHPSAAVLGVLVGIVVASGVTTAAERRARARGGPTPTEPS